MLFDVDVWDLCIFWIVTPYQIHCLQLSSPIQFSSVAQLSDSLWSHGLQYARLPCPSPTRGACSNSCPSSRWCHSTIPSSVIPFSSCLQSFPVSGSWVFSRNLYVLLIFSFTMQKIFSLIYPQLFLLLFPLPK